MGIEIIIGGIIAAILAVGAAFGIGKYKGRTVANADNTAKTAATDAKRTVESNQKATEAQLKVKENADEIRDGVAKLPDGDALSELRRDYSRD